MILTVKPAIQLRGAIDLPSSKSYTIRAFLIASCGGISSIVNPSDCDDAKVALRVVRQLGSKVVYRKYGHWQIKAFPKSVQSQKINVGESGTVLRFLLPLLSVRGKNFDIYGEGTLISRPNLFLTQTLRSRGVSIHGQGPQESTPIHIHESDFHGGKIAIDGSLSSQFISALLTACPSLLEDTHLIIKGHKIVSEVYITMTQQILRKAGIHIRQNNQRHFYIKGHQRFKGLKNFIVPADYGLAAFFLAAGTLINSHLVLKGYLTDQFIQADAMVMGFLKKMGVTYLKEKSAIKISGPQKIRGGHFSLKDCPDLVPIMAVLALFAKGKTRLSDIGHARAKESDRISDLRGELLKVGAKVEEKKNALIIYPQSKYRTHVVLDPHNDHRLAMAFSILGLKLGARIKDIECTRKSYPQFVKDLKNIGAVVSKY